MPADTADDHLAPLPAAGRVYTGEILAELADAAPSGRVRLDALARWLQDVARADVVDAGLGDEGAWVVRRVRLEVERFPRFGERCTLRTWCSGAGRMVAERRTSIEGESARAEAVALWVHIDPQRGRPAPLSERIDAIYSPSANGRAARTGLRHPPPPDDAGRTTWRFRATDLDVAGHVNNAAYWTIAEEELLSRDGDGLQPLSAEIEFRGGTDAGDATVLSKGGQRWVLEPGGAVAASLRLPWTP